MSCHAMVECSTLRYWHFRNSIKSKQMELSCSVCAAIRVEIRQPIAPPTACGRRTVIVTTEFKAHAHTVRNSAGAGFSGCVQPIET